MSDHVKNQGLNFNDAPDQDATFEKMSTDEIRSELLNQIEQLLYYLFPAGCIKNNVFSIGDIKGTKGESLKIELKGTNAGLWKDFATDEGGDIFDLWAACNGLDTKTQFPALVETAQKWLGMEKPNYKPLTPPTSPTNDLGPYTHKWNYRDGDDKLIACIYRYDLPDGKKEYRPWDVLAKKSKAPNIRPLYNQPGLKTTTDVVLVEGEKAADALISQGFAATTAMFGSNAPLEKTDWSPLKDKHVLIWHDNDDAGREYAKKLQEYLPGSVTSLTNLDIPADKSEGWDAADAVDECLDIKVFIKNHIVQPKITPPTIPAYTVGQLLDDTSPIPTDLIAPRILTPRGLLVFGGAPKVGKSDFLLSWLAHMAAGATFLGMKPPRPLRIFYLQAEIDYHYLRERLQMMHFPESLLPLVRENLIITPQCKIILDESGVNATANTIDHFFETVDDIESVDIIVVDPLRNVFDGGTSGATENDNTGMLFFLQQRLEVLRDRINPNAGIILVHHTHKTDSKQFEEDPFQALSGASSLRGYYSTGMIMFQPDQAQTERQIIFELRNGPKLPRKLVDKVNGGWLETEYGSTRLVNQNFGEKLDAERRRKHDIILEIIYNESSEGKIYTSTQFCELFESKAGLGSADTIRKRINTLATKGYIKFFKNGEDYGLPTLERCRYGYLCVEDMQLGTGDEFDPDTGELPVQQNIYPTHYKNSTNGILMPVEDKNVWVYHEQQKS